MFAVKTFTPIIKDERSCVPTTWYFKSVYTYIGEVEIRGRLKRRKGQVYGT